MINDVDFNYEFMNINDKMNLLALLPCPLKVSMERAFINFYEMHKNEFKDFKYLIDSNANNQLVYNEHLEYIQDIEELPDIIIASGVNGFYHKKFVDKFIDKGLFTNCWNISENKEIKGIKINDDMNNYTILCANVLVMVVDKLQMGENTDYPKSWKDILDEKYNDKVAIRGKNNVYCETTLLTIYKDFGMDGIRNLARSVKYGWHPSQMAKAAGSGRQGSPAVSVMPYFFTKTIKNKENVQIIWPEEGGIISPVTMLAKTEKISKLKSVIDFFTGTEAGKIYADTYFPAVNPLVDNKIPKDASYNWLGWDFIRKNDLGLLVNNLNDEFNNYAKKY